MADYPRNLREKGTVMHRIKWNKEEIIQNEVINGSFEVASRSLVSSYLGISGAFQTVKFSQLKDDKRGALQLEPELQALLDRALRPSFPHPYKSLFY